MDPERPPRQTILIVDDQEVNTLLVETILASQGYEIISHRMGSGPSNWWQPGRRILSCLISLCLG